MPGIVENNACPGACATLEIEMRCTFVGMPSHGNLSLDGFKLKIPLYAAGIDTDPPELVNYLFCTKARMHT